jgi:hypothetical protein
VTSIPWSRVQKGGLDGHQPFEEVLNHTNNTENADYIQMRFCHTPFGLGSLKRLATPRIGRVGRWDSFPLLRTKNGHNLFGRSAGPI